MRKRSLSRVLSAALAVMLAFTSGVPGTPGRFAEAAPTGTPTPILTANKLTYHFYDANGESLSPTGAPTAVGLVSPSDEVAGTDVSAYYTRSGDDGGPYTYEAAEGTYTSGTRYYRLPTEFPVTATITGDSVTGKYYSEVEGEYITASGEAQANMTYYTPGTETPLVEDPGEYEGIYIREGLGTTGSPYTFRLATQEDFEGAGPEAVSVWSLPTQATITNVHVDGTVVSGKYEHAQNGLVYTLTSDSYAQSGKYYAEVTAAVDSTGWVEYEDAVSNAPLTGENAVTLPSVPAVNGRSDGRWVFLNAEAGASIATTESGQVASFTSEFLDANYEDGFDAVFQAAYTDNRYRITYVTPEGSVFSKTAFYPEYDTANGTINGGTTDGGKVFSYSEIEGGAITLPAISKPGYTFDGWYYSKDNTAVLFDTEGAKTGLLTINDTTDGKCTVGSDGVKNLKLYAKLTANSNALKYFKVDPTSEAGATTHLEATQIVGEGTGVATTYATGTTQVLVPAISVSATLGAGYEFGGWFTEASLESAYALSKNSDGLYVFDTKNKTGALSLYAKLTPISSNITWKDAETSDSTTVYPVKWSTDRPGKATYGADLVVKAPTRVNYEFAGFKINNAEAIATGTNTIDKDGNVTIKKADIPATAFTVTATWTAETHTYEFELNGGISTRDGSTTYTINNAGVATPATITLTKAEVTKADYDFGGWYTDKEFKKAVPAKTGVDNAYEYTIKSTDTEGITFYAKWTPKTTGRYYTVTYKGLEGATNDSKNPANVLADVTGETPKTITFYAPVKDFYTFNGWYKDSKFEEPLTGSGPWTLAVSNSDIQKGITVYAKWTPDNETVAFNYNGGYQGSANETVAYGTSLGKVLRFTETPEYVSSGTTDFTFVGWFYTVDDVEYQATASTVVDKNVLTGNTLALKARWKGAAKSVIFNSNYGTDVRADQTFTLATFVGDTAIVPDNEECGFAAPAGYEFKGWALTASGAVDASLEPSTKVDITSALIPAAEMKLYAKWDVASYNVIFDIGDGVAVSDIDTDVLGGITSATVNHGSKSYYYTGYTTELLVGDKYTLTGEEFTRVGYTLSGWKCSNGKSYKTGDVLQSLSTTNDDYVKLTAEWKPETYSVKLDTNGGVFASDNISTAADKKKIVDRISSYTTNDITSFVAIPNPYKKGFTFDYWYVDKDDDTSNISTAAGFGPGYLNVGRTGKLYSATLYAKYTVSTASISYNQNIDGAETVVLEGAHPYDESFDLGAFVAEANKEDGSPFKRNGYTLSSFNTQADGKGTKYAVDASITKLEDNVTLYGQWAANSYKLSYDLKKGKVKKSEPKSYKTGTGVALQTPTKKGYTFGGWTISNANVTVTADANGVYSVDPASYGKAKLTAIWVPVEYDIEFIDADDETRSVFYSDVYGERAKYGQKVNLAAGALALQRGNNGDKAASKIRMKNSKGKYTKNLNLKNYYSATKFGDAVLSEEGIVKVYVFWSSSNLYNIEYDNLHANDQQKYPKTYKAKSVSKFPTPKWPGYKFTGWTLNGDTTTTYTTSKKLVKAIKAQTTKGDIVVTANFAEVNFNVKIYPNGSNVVKDGQEVTKAAAYSVEYNASQTETIAGLGWQKNGYTFVGFAADKKGKKMLTDTAAEALEMCTLGTKNKQNVKVYAIWELNNTKHVNKAIDAFAILDNEVLITSGTEYDTLKATLQPESATKVSKAWKALYKNKALTFGKKVTLEKPSVPGYTFVGWELLNAGADKQSVTMSGNYVTVIKKGNDADVNLRAIFKAEKVTAAFDPNGGHRYEAGNKITTGFTYSDGLENPISYNRNIFVKANAEALKVAFIDNNNKVINVEKNGYICTGYAYDKAGKQDITKTSINPKKGSTVTFYPIWERPEDVEVTIGTPAATSFNVKFEGNAQCKYEIEYSTSISFRKGATYSKVVDYDADGPYTISNAEGTPVAAGKEYYVRVRPIVVDSQSEDGKPDYEGGWSVMKSVRTTGGI
ncbi:InlB B-repeat-containing protein [Butyrivibrio sp. MC2013]|uniref:InlB B-repeat-containing protein n=1 Tax=Butyrivibrio sp. MC2013 TaxID=1280686 RepID=UPI00047A1232|nr:InlB B-repeat-containing protein [Butyrivibrio sp. MC2013]